MRDSTGIPGLDKILNGIIPGDNIVWQTDVLEHFLPYVKPYCEYAKNNGRPLIYFRFAGHTPFVSEADGAQVCVLHPEDGFEKFITQMHDVITKTGDGAYYVFDSLSELAVESFSESMIENFFVLTCPRLLKMKCIAYFVVTSNLNSYHATRPITKTTQLILDIYSRNGREFIQPVKVDGRYSSEMFMLHERVGDDFMPVMNSSDIAEISASDPWYGLQSAPYRAVGLWDRLFIESEDVIESCRRGECSLDTVREIFLRQLKQIFSNDARMLEMAEKFIDLPELIHIWKRTIGTGMIGGKSAGMLLAHAILKKHFPKYTQIIEKHDSFYIGSDIFYSFLVRNGCWHIRQNQKNPATIYDRLEEARALIINGEFLETEKQKFSDMLDYFGQAPIIVRSSSLLEDNFGNAFSGKYESIFCVNNGTKEKRLEEFLKAVRLIYASTMSKEALAYRARRNVLDMDEQMALLVQRVSGTRYEKIFMPQLAGVGFSYNSYKWDESIDPAAGLIRLVYGLGTRAVDRHDDDYTRIVAVNAPEKRPEGNQAETAKFTQKRVDVLDIQNNVLKTDYFTDILKENAGLDPEMFSLEREYNGAGYRIINFDTVLSGTEFIKDMGDILSILRDNYGSQVDIEFTANFTKDKKYRINLLQCRPQHVRKESGVKSVLPTVSEDKIILKSKGGLVGQGRTMAVDRIIYVVPGVYGLLPEQDRYSVARLVGRAAHFEEETGKNIMLLGPGRWGTRMVQLGVPVVFSEINTASVICEIGKMHEGLIPDLSMGTHFFNDLVEMNILYIGFFASAHGNVLNEKFIESLLDSFPRMFPGEKNYGGAVRVIEGKDLKIYLQADPVKQECVVFAG
ncbi:MAG: pyruvate, phosphate dikinase [Candidatus Goldbacteria bacterium]|nr:pyruvate, phosphate dikinase [Candidatus Goldiibacteriota bacterium]